MFRNSFALKLKEGRRYCFGQILKENWEDITAELDKRNISNFSMWTAGGLIFGYYESETEVENWTADERKFFDELDKKFEGCYDWLSTPFKPMRLMYHDFGVVRQSKELIRHRVFITKLVEGSEEEYKARHDALVEARHGEINPGPDSNFSIWNASGYIFGYDEIDTTMEQDRTEADRQADIAWETKMLEIMSWITNDVDWITGECHEQIKKLCAHN